MPSILYTTICYIKNDLYRISINTNDNEQNFNDIDSSDFTSPDIPVDKIIPSLTEINFELINKNKNTTIPQILTLNHILTIQQTQIIRKKNQKTFDDRNEITTIYETITPIIEQSQQTSQTTLNTYPSQTTIPSTINARRQYNFGRFFSTQTYTDSEINQGYKTGIIIKYINISNSIRWNIKTIQIDVKTEDIANELYTNLNLCLSTLKERPKNLLAFVNPFGGKGK